MSQIIVASNQPWLQYFDRSAAARAVEVHISKLPSDARPEQHTRKVYQAGLKDFAGWIGDRLPTPDLLDNYVSHLIDRNLKSSTIGSKYLAPIRLFLKKLSGQYIPNLTGAEREFVSDCRYFISEAAKVATPKATTTTNVPALWRSDFKRLTETEVNAVLRKIDRKTLSGMRDYALMFAAFTTAMRLAEIASITLDCISMTDDGTRHLLNVMGKRGNTSPVPLPNNAYAALKEYVEAYNAPLDADDPRRIQGDVPIWQPLTRSGNYVTIGKHDPCKGIAHQTIRDVIGKTTESALGSSRKLAPHDTRRSAASIGYDKGMPLPDLQQLLRHKNAAQTMEYVGVKPDYHKRDLSTYVTFG